MVVEAAANVSLSHVSIKSAFVSESVSAGADEIKGGSVSVMLLPGSEQDQSGIADNNIDIIFAFFHDLLFLDYIIFLFGEPYPITGAYHMG